MDSKIINHKSAIRNPRRILFVRTGAIGNALAAVPAIRALRRGWPECRITVITERLGEELLRGCPYIDEFMIYEKNGEQKGMAEWYRMLVELRRRDFTHAILSKRYFRMSFLARLTQAPVRVGFAGYGFGLTIAINWIPKRHVIDTNLDLVAALGIEQAGRQLEIWPSDADKELVGKFLSEHGLQNHRMLVAMHAGGVSKRQYGWPAKRYAELATALEKQYGAAIILLGAATDLEQISEISTLAGKRFPDTASAGLNLRATAQLISQCRFFIGADSSPSHLANAVQTPGIIYYGPQPELDVALARWKPEGDLWMAVGPEPDGSHPDVRKMLLNVSELIHRMNQAGKW